MSPVKNNRYERRRKKWQRINVFWRNVRALNMEMMKYGANSYFIVDKSCNWPIDLHAYELILLLRRGDHKVDEALRKHLFYMPWFQMHFDAIEKIIA